MKKGIILLALIFGACVNLENVGSNSGGDVKEIKTANINTSKNYEKRNGVLYVDNVLANGKQEYKEKNGVVIRGNYREGLPDGVQEKYYPSGKIYGKNNIIPFFIRPPKRKKRLKENTFFQPPLFNF